MYALGYLWSHTIANVWTVVCLHPEFMMKLVNVRQNVQFLQSLFPGKCVGSMNIYM